ncbi:MAG: response regulator [Desulfobacterales bacterium]|nr:response regulator [Desulfobacterales bacterium]
MKILVVDDELVSRKKMHKIMEGIGECISVESGKQAIRSFKEAWEEGVPFEVISLDIFMPDMSGIEVLTKIREVEKEKQVPKEKQVKIMMVTSYSEKDIVIASLKAGCDNYVVKPFNSEKVRAKLIGMGLNIKED